MADRSLWRHFYYQVLKGTGRPLSEYFASSSVTKDGGFQSLGWTENYQKQRGELYAVKTDSNGLAGACGDVNTATSLTAINPVLSPVTQNLPVGIAVVSGGTPQVKISATAIVVGHEC
ncbi:MAG TPA: hypothetical protein VKX16_08885 [Chloroflexota bacterium]|nr:hypothetical protein [Chloroflexota bacterium]